MPTIKVEQFGGIAPRFHPALLPTTMAQTAHNCVLKSGKLVPLREPKKTSLPVRFASPKMKSLSEAKTLYIWRHPTADGNTSKEVAELLAWNDVVSVTKSNVSGDPYARLFVTGASTGAGEDGNEPAIYFYERGFLRRQTMVKETLPAPVAKRSNGEVTAEQREANPNTRYTQFFQTWVDSYGYESGPSMPSDEVEYYDGNAITIRELTDVPSGAAKRRIYKVVAGTESGAVQFVSEQATYEGAFQEYSFRLRDDEVGEAMPTFEMPPSDLQWLSFVPGGFYTGFSKSARHELRFSEVGAPISWPAAYGYSVEDNIVGVGVTLNNVFAITDGRPYVFTGSAPDAMVGNRIASEQGCVSARSICSMGGAIYYVSQDGICRLSDSSSTVEIITSGYFSKREWNEFSQESCRMIGYDNKLIVFFDWKEIALIVDVNDGQSAVTTCDCKGAALAVSVNADICYFVSKIS